MNFENMTVSENSQMQKTIFYDYTVWFPLYDISRMSKFIEGESTLVVSRGWCEGRWRVIVNGHSVVFGGEEHNLELDRGCSCKYYKHTNCHWIIHFEIAKMANFTLCEFSQLKKKKKRISDLYNFLIELKKSGKSGCEGN